MKVSLIAAMDRDRMIGRDGQLPWRLPRDLQRFKERTLGHAILMGRKTFESIGRALPGRDNLVWTSRPSLAAPGLVLVRGMEEAIEWARGRGHSLLAVVGGAEVYRSALPFADELDLTLLDGSFGPGDAYFPAFEFPSGGRLRFEGESAEWSVQEEVRPEPDDRNPHPYRICVLHRGGESSPPGGSDPGGASGAPS